MRTFTFAAVACLLAGCANQPSSTAPAVASNGSKPACDNSQPETGSHLVDRHNCSRGNVVVVVGDAVENAMRQSTPGSVQSH